MNSPHNSQLPMCASINITPLLRDKASSNISKFSISTKLSKLFLIKSSRKNSIILRPRFIKDLKIISRAMLTPTPRALTQRLSHVSTFFQLTSQIKRPIKPPNLTASLCGKILISLINKPNKNFAAQFKIFFSN